MWHGNKLRSMTTRFCTNSCNKLYYVAFQIIRNTNRIEFDQSVKESGEYGILEMERNPVRPGETSVAKMTSSFRNARRVLFTTILAVPFHFRTQWGKSETYQYSKKKKKSTHVRVRMSPVECLSNWSIQSVYTTSILKTRLHISSTFSFVNAAVQPCRLNHETNAWKSSPDTKGLQERRYRKIKADCKLQSTWPQWALHGYRRFPFWNRA